MLYVNCPKCKNTKIVENETDIIVCDICGHQFILSECYENNRGD